LRRLRLRLEVSDDLSDARELTFLFHDLDERAGRRGAQLDRRLVRLEESEDLILRREVPFGLLPLADLDFGDRFSDLRDSELDTHESSFLKERGRRRRVHGDPRRSHPQATDRASGARTLDGRGPCRAAERRERRAASEAPSPCESPPRSRAPGTW